MEAQFSNNHTVFEFEGLWGLRSACGLRIFDKGKNQVVVVVSELYKENPGTSIAQVPASLAMQVCHAYGLDVQNIVYIEHNPDMHSKLSFYEEEFFRVYFEYDGVELANPSWERIDSEQLKQYIE